MSESKQNSKTSRNYEKHWKIISILLILFAVLLFFAMISYHKSDEPNTQVTVGEFFSLFTGNPDIEAKAATAKNWLGLFGAILADFFFKQSVGYWIIFLPYFIIMWALNLFTGKKVSNKLIKQTGIYLLLILLISGLIGSLQNVSWIFHIPYEWSGTIGQFLAEISSGIIGTLGSFLIFTAGIVITLILGTDIDFSKYFKTFSGMAENVKDSTKKFSGDIKNEKKAKAAEKSKKDLQEDERRYENNPEEKIQIDENHEEPEDTFEQKMQEERKSPNIKIIRPKQIKDPKSFVSKKDLESEEQKNQKTENKEQIIDSDISGSKESNTENLNEPESDMPETNQSQENLENKLENKEEEKQQKNTDISGSEEKEEKTGKEHNSNNKNDEHSDNDEDQDKALNIHLREKQAEKKEEEKGPVNPLGSDIHEEEIPFQPPTLDLLDQTIEDVNVSETELKTNAQIIQEKLETFKIYIEDLGVTPGPVVTQYEFVPAPGIKISKIENLADDLAMALKAKGIRIIAPIPEKGTVGIEIPNSNPSIVTFYDVASSETFVKSDAKLPIALGKKISGEVSVIDLADMPHLLIGGSTGSGKSVGINTIITSLMYKIHPKMLKFVLIDPKKVELLQYSNIKDHFLACSPDTDATIVNTPADAVVILKAAVKEMEKRYDILSSVAQRNIEDYNKKVQQGRFQDDPKIKHKPMPYIVVIIDELADLMLTAAKEVEEPITRLAQMARAVGIHLVVATQRPSVDVITGLIKANFPARISYAVSSKIDSRTILDMQGAETLLGKGDMLCLPAGVPKPIRVQNSFLSTDEVEDVCRFIGKQRGYTEPYYLPSLNEDNSEPGEVDLSDRDPLFEEAARLIIRHQQGSVSLLQRRLKIGYARAGRIVDELEAAGVVGPFDGSKARRVLMESEAELEAVL